MKTLFLLFVCYIFKVSCQDQSFDCRRVSNACANDGVCGSVADTDCECKPGFIGYDCSFTDAGAPCTEETNTCLNGATCSLVNNVQQCACPFGFYGAICETPVLEIDCTGQSVQFTMAFPSAFEGSIMILPPDAAVPVSDDCVFTQATADNMVVNTLSVDLGAVVAGQCNQANTITTTEDVDNKMKSYTGLFRIQYMKDLVTSIDEIATLRCIHKGQDIEMWTEIKSINVDNIGNLSIVEKNKTYSPIQFEILSVDGSPVKTPLYVGDQFLVFFYLTDLAVYSDLFIESAVSNNTLEGADQKTYDLFKRGCPTKSGRRTTAEQEQRMKEDENPALPSRPGKSITVSAFKFIDSINIGMFFNLRLCETGDTSCNAPGNCLEIMNQPDPTDAPAPTEAATPTGDTGATGGETVPTAAGDTGAPGGDTTVTGGEAAPTAAGDTEAPAATGGETAPTEAATPARRRRRAADDNQTRQVSTILTVLSPNELVGDSRRTGTPSDSTVEECLARSEILAVLVVLASFVLILFVACFVLACLMVRKKGKKTHFEPSYSSNSHDRFHIPRAHVNGAFRDI